MLDPTPGGASTTPTSPMNALIIPTIRRAPPFQSPWSVGCRAVEHSPDTDTAPPVDRAPFPIRSSCSSQRPRSPADAYECTGGRLVQRDVMPSVCVSLLGDG
jgi:hypothetical protein